MLKRHAIQVLRSAGHALDEIVTLVAVGKRTVQRVVDEPMLTAQSAATLARESPRRSIGRPSKAAAYRGLVTTWLTDEPQLLSVELLRRAKLAGYDGGKSALYALVRDVRVVTPRPVIRFEGLYSRARVSGTHSLKGVLGAEPDQTYAPTREECS